MFCRQCGQKVNPEGKFCGGCGAPISKKVAEQVQSPVEQAPVEQAPVEQAPVEQAPVEQAPVEQVPVKQAPVEQVPVEQVPVKQAPIEPTPVQPPPVQQAPVQQMPPPVQPAPVYHSPEKADNSQYKIVAAVLAGCLGVVLAGGGFYLSSRGDAEGESSSSESIEETITSESTSTDSGMASDSSETAIEGETTSSSSTTAPSSSSSSSSSSTDAVVEEAPEEVPVENRDYIIPHSNWAVVTSDDLVGLTAEQLQIARNEIYARHGREFSSDMLNEWFNSKEWYQNIYPKYSPTDFDKRSPFPLSTLELENIEIIKRFESIAGNVAG